MENEIVEPLIKDALTKPDFKVLLSLALTFLVLVLREKAFAKTTMPGRFGNALRWLGNTHFGGVVTAMLLSGFGAVLSAIGTKTWPSPWVALNIFVVAALSSGISTYIKTARKQKEDTTMPTPAPAIEEKKEPPVPPPLPPPPSLIVLALVGSLLTGCATARDVAVGIKGEASFGLMSVANAVYDWDEETKMNLAKEAKKIGTESAIKEGEAAIMAQDKKARDINKAIKTAWNAIKLLAAAIDGVDGGVNRNWAQLTKAVIDAYTAVRDVLKLYNVNVPIPALSQHLGNALEMVAYTVEPANVKNYRIAFLILKKAQVDLRAMERALLVHQHYENVANGGL